MPAGGFHQEVSAREMNIGNCIWSLPFEFELIGSMIFQFHLFSDLEVVCQCIQIQIVSFMHVLSLILEMLESGSAILTH